MEGLHHQLVFYASVAPLVAFYVFFAAVLYPASAHLHPHGFYAAAAPLVPIGLRGLLKVQLSTSAAICDDQICTYKITWQSGDVNVAGVRTVPSACMSDC